MIEDFITKNIQESIDFSEKRFEDSFYTYFVKCLRQINWTSNISENLKFYDQIEKIGLQKLDKKVQKGYLVIHVIKLKVELGKAKKNEETLKSIISKYESSNNIDFVKSCYPNEYRYLIGLANLEVYGIYSDIYKGFVPFDKSKYLIRGKNKILRTYESIVIKNERPKLFDKTNLEYYVAQCFAFSGRYQECLFFIDKIKENNLNSEYFNIIVLDEIRKKTCLDYSATYFVKIKKEYDKYNQRYERAKIKNPRQKILDDQKQSIEDLLVDIQKFIDAHDIDINKVEEDHDQSIHKPKSKYIEFCFKNKLFLNEHSMFCECNKGYNDELKIETLHEHTKKNFVNENQIILNEIVSQFSLARLNYYKSINDNYDGLFPSVSSKTNLKNTLLKNTVKSCFSVLDQIAYSVVYILKGTPFNGKLYFTDLFENENLELNLNKIFNGNIFLFSLYTISEDFNTSNKKSGLQSLKKLRNDFEHKVVLFNKSKSMKSVDYNEVSRSCLFLLGVTKSAISSYCYYVRHESKKDKYE